MRAQAMDFGRLTVSTRQAFEWAGLRAVERARRAGARGPALETAEQSDGEDNRVAAEIVAADILTGIVLSHGESAEPIELLRHAGVLLVKGEGSSIYNASNEPVELQAFVLAIERNTRVRSLVDFSSPRLTPKPVVGGQPGVGSCQP